jgi:N-methylhydantoinase B
MGRRVAVKATTKAASVKEGRSRRETVGVPLRRDRARPGGARRSPEQRIGSVDPIKAEVIARFLLATAEEMGATLMRTAFSPNIKERADCSTAIFDRAGEVIALAQRVPIHLGSMVGAIAEILKRFPEAEIKPGDMFIANDPYNGGGTHLPDINVIAPVFIGKRIVAYVANIAHHADVGGMVPGSEAAVCQSIYQEGLRIPPVRIMQGGKLNRDVFDIILLNSRTPEERVGDLQAQFAANTVGARSVVSLFERYGVRETEATVAAYLDFTEKRFRAAISKLPRGRYEAEDHLDGNDETSTAKIRLALTVHRSRLDFDFAGSAPQLECARNIPYRALLATVYTVAKALLDPEVPANAGYYRTLKISAPAGCVVGPVPPAAIGCRSISASVLGDVIAAALSQALPHKALAGSGPHHLYVLSGTDPRTRRYFVNYETLAGGMGARANRDGVDGVRVHASGSSNLPIEALEHAYPFRVERYALWEGSGGAGRYRGGMGVIRDYRVLADDIAVSLSSERQHVAASGAHGGGEGALGSFVLNPGASDERTLPSAAADVRLPRDSVFRICTPAGGGYGEALERDAAAVERDIRDERQSVDAARDVHGYPADHS